MNKSDLKNGMILVLRNGCKVDYYKGYMMDFYSKVIIKMDNYNDDLTYNDRKCDFWDICEIIENDFVIWKREDIDWSKVPVDTKVLVSDGGKHWYKRYFMKYGEGMYYTFPDGLTSWSANEENGVIKWKYCKLAEEQKEITEEEIYEKYDEYLCSNKCKENGLLKSVGEFILENYNVTRK